MALSEVYVSVPMPDDLAGRLRQVADRDYSTVAATARRLIALGVARELPPCGASTVAAQRRRTMDDTAIGSR